MVRISSFHPPRRCCGGGGGGNQNTFYCVGARLTAHQRLSNSRLLLPKSPHSAASATAKLCLKLCFRCASALLHRPTEPNRWQLRCMWAQVGNHRWGDGKRRRNNFMASEAVVVVQNSKLQYNRRYSLSVCIYVRIRWTPDARHLPAPKFIQR